MRTKFEAVAIATTDTQGRYMTRAIIRTIHPEQAIAIASALQGVEQVTAIPVLRDFDVFGRQFWTNREPR